MADLKKTIELIFGVKDNTVFGLSAISGNIKNLSARVENLAKPFAQVGETILSSTKSIALYSAAVASIATYKSGNFEDSIREIGALFSADTEEVEKLSDEILSFSENSSSSLEEIIGATYNVISATGDHIGAMGRLNTAENLANAASTNLSVSMQTLSTAMNAYGAGSEEAERFADVLFATVQNGVTDMDKLSQNIGKVTSTANASKVPFGDLGASIAAISSETGATSETMTQLNQLFTSLVSPSKELSAALGDVEFTGDNLQEVMNRLKDATGGSLDKMNDLFPSVEASKAALILANDASGTFAKTLLIMGDNTGVVSEESDKMAENFGKNVQLLINNLDGTLIKIGKPLLNNFSDTVKGTTAVLQGLGIGVSAPNFQAVNQTFDNFTRDLKIFAVDVGSAIPTAMAKLDFTALVASIGDLGDEFADAFDSIFGADLDLTKPDDLAKALQVAVNLITRLVEATKGIIESFSPVFEIIGKAGKEISSFDSETSTMIGKLTGYGKQIELFGGIFGVLLITLNESKADIEQVFNDIDSVIKIAINSLQIAFDSVAQIILSIAEGFGRLAEFTSITDADEEKWKNFADEMELLSNGIRANQTNNIDEMVTAWDKFGNKTDTTTKDLEVSSDNMESSINSIIEPINKASVEMTALEKASIEAKNSLDTLSESNRHLEVMEENTTKAEIAFAKMASSERVETQKLNVELSAIAGKIFEAQIKLDITQTEEATKRLKSSFESIDTVIQTTGDLLTSLFSIESNDWSKNLRIKDAIDNETQIRNEAAQQQHDLIQSQIDYFDARSASLQNGLSEISITADGLEPELEAFMWAILDRIKLRATQDQANFLVGAG